MKLTELILKLDQLKPMFEAVLFLFIRFFQLQYKGMKTRYHLL